MDLVSVAFKSNIMSYIIRKGMKLYTWRTVQLIVKVFFNGKFSIHENDKTQNVKMRLQSQNIYEFLQSSEFFFFNSVLY